MAIGTAGYTAMLCVLALERQGVKPGDGDVLVTGATGGVGSVATALLSALGYRVTGSTGKSSEAAYLQSLGAAAVIDRAELSAPGKPMQKERWAGVIDAVGSHTLANACAQTRYGGVVAACGMAQGIDLLADVVQFISGVRCRVRRDSPRPAPAGRDRLERDWTCAPRHGGEFRLNAVGVRRLDAGKVRGRLVVNIQ